jgi:glucose-6-phosphate-specific signal transduction histidine kinase
MGLFGLIFGLRLQRDTDTGEAITLLFVLPVALLAVTFGRRGGVASGLFGVALVAVWVQTEGVHLSPVGWASRVVPLVLLGTLLGQAMDGLHRAGEERRALESAALLHREAIEINDTLVQGMAAAKWALEAGRLEAGLATLTQTIELGHRLVSELIREAERTP